MTSDDFPRVELGFFPTPIDTLTRLSEEIGVTLRMKRDDYSGFGGGGNKVRKLEYLMADALAQKAGVLITTGGHQSNHARMVAAAARRFGMQAVLILRGDAPSEYQGNLLLNRMFGARLEFLDPTDYFHLIDGRMAAHAAGAEASGTTPYIIPLGGANPLGALGYVRAVEEMTRQLEAMRLSAPDFIVAPAGSGGTLAGLYVGVRRHWPNTKIIGVSVSRDSAWFQQRIAVMAGECAALLDWKMDFQPSDIRIEDGFVGKAYGIPSPGGIDAIGRIARSDGVLLDPVYTGKAMHGVLSLVEKGDIPRGSDVLFVHCGGSPALYPFAKTLIGDAGASPT
jgi:D-cysteine desulfhydrase family pyridoxal phosphate-dependent enzyme